MKAIKNPIESVSKAILLLLGVQIVNKSVPDYALSNVCFQTGLTDKEARKVRDIIQSDFEIFWKK